MSAGLRQLVAAFSLVAYLWMGTPLGPVAAAAVASLGGEHRVQIASDGAGMKVVLHHESSGLHSHSHCLVSNALVWLADASSASTSDHVLSFQKAQLTTVRDSLETLVVRAALDTGLASGVMPESAWFGSSRLEAPLLAIPPPSWSVSVVRSTVFLI